MNKKHVIYLLFVSFLVILFAGVAECQDRFPRPEFESAYKKPQTQAPAPGSLFGEASDMFVLVVLLSLTVVAVHKLRSRKAVFVLMIISLMYFGFFRKGCICSVGSVQNVAEALWNHGLFLPLSVGVFFLAPLIFSLFYGRVFCASVCPLGAVQDLLSVKSVKVPEGVSAFLGIIPYFYLGFALLFAANRSGYIICRFDPFVSVFRVSGDFISIIITAAFVITSLFIARPYCRFFCPYGVILGWMSKISFNHLKITEGECIKCRLCEDSCPVGAISEPSETVRDRKGRKKRILILILILFPLITGAGGFVFAQFSDCFALVNDKVSLLRDIELENRGVRTEFSEESSAFRSEGRSLDDLKREVKEIRRGFYKGSWALGLFLGFVIMFKITAASLYRERDEYYIKQELCVSCCRCTEYCPVKPAENRKVINNG